MDQNQFNQCIGSFCPNDENGTWDNDDESTVFTDVWFSENRD